MDDPTVTGRNYEKRLEPYLGQLSQEDGDSLREALSSQGLPSRNQALLDILRKIDRPELQRAIADTLGITPQQLGKVGLHVYDGNTRALYRSALRSQGYTVPQYLALPLKDRQELRRFIRSALDAPSTSTDAHYVRLDEVVSLVRLKLEQTEEAGSYYEQLVSGGLSHDHIKQVLGVDHSVQPATIGHDIQSQSRNQWRAFVELVSNAVDASNTSHTSIGRFGVGFYQILSHLRTEEDEVKVVTSTEQDSIGTEISFRLLDGSVCVRVRSTEQPVSIGTQVQVKAKHLNARPINQAIGRTFSYSDGITLTLNGKPLETWGEGQSGENRVEIESAPGSFSVRDYGKGMSPQQVFERLLVPKLSSKPPVYELRNREIEANVRYELGKEDTRQGSVVITVGGLLIEEFSLSGSNLAETVVLDFPAGAMLGEERLEVAIDEVGIATLKSAIDKVLEMPEGAREQVLNTLAPALEKLQARSQVSERGSHLLEYLQKKAQDVYDGRAVLPNAPELEALDCPKDVLFLNPLVCGSSPERVASATEDKQWRSTPPHHLYMIPYKAGQTAGVIGHKRNIFLDERVPTEAYPREVARAISRLIPSVDGKFAPMQDAATATIGTADLLSMSVAELIEARASEFGFESPRVARLQADRLHSRCPILFESEVTQHLLSTLPRGAATEVFILLEKLATDPKTEDHRKLEIIESVAKQTDMLLACEGIREQANLFGTPFIARWDYEHPELPEFLRAHTMYFDEPFEHEGRTYYRLYDIERRSGLGEIIVTSDGRTLEERPERSIGRESEEEVSRDAPITQKVNDRLELHWRPTYYSPNYSGNMFEIGKTKYYPHPMARLVSQDGDTIWKLDTERWVSNYLRGHRNSDRTFSVPPVGIVHYDHPPESDEPALLIYNYRMSEAGGYSCCVHREIAGYVDFEGKEYDIRRGDGAINAATLAKKYGKFIDDYRAYGGGYTSCYSVPTPAALDYGVLGNFSRDPRTGEWSTLAYRNNERANDHSPQTVDYQLLVVDQNGENPALHPIGQVRNQWKGTGIKGLRPQHRSYMPLIPQDVRELRDYHTGEAVAFSCLREGENGEMLLNFRPPNTNRFDSKYKYVDPTHKEYSYSDQPAELTPGHSAAIQSFLTTQVELDPNKFSKLMQRSMQAGQLDVDDFKAMIPALYALKEMRPSTLSPPVVSLLAQCSYLDKSRFSALVELVDRSLPNDEERLPDVAGRIVSFYVEKLQSQAFSETAELLRRMHEGHVYSDGTHCDGYALIRYGTEVPQAELTGVMHSFVNYVRGEFDDNTLERDALVSEPEAAPDTMLLSQLMLWKRRNEKSARSFRGSSSELCGLVSSVASGANTTHLQREISHAVHFLDVGTAGLFLRELVQNAIDAETDEKGSNRAVDIALSRGTDQDLGIFVRDTRGMTRAEVINYLLVPGETTKASGDKIGRFGVGLFTLFKDSKEAWLKTGTGNGETTYLCFEPIVVDGITRDIRIKSWSVAENYKGTVIGKSVLTKNPNLEASVISSQVKSMLSGLSEEHTRVRFQDRVLNGNYETLARVPVSDLGYIRVMANPHRVLSHRGLTLRDLTASDFPVPSFVRDKLLEQGRVSIELPENCELTRSRTDIAQRERIESELTRGMQSALVNAYLESIVRTQDGARYLADFPWDHLPTDYFSRVRVNNPDAERIAHEILNGELENPRTRLAEPDFLLEVLTYLPLVQIGNVRWSMFDLGVAYRNSKGPFETAETRKLIPRAVSPFIAHVDNLKRDKEFVVNQIQEGKVTFTATGNIDLSNVARTLPEDASQRVTKHSDAIFRFQAIACSIVDTLNMTYFPDELGVSLNFSYVTGGPLAHTNRGEKRISVNLFELVSERNFMIQEMKNFLARSSGVGALDNITNTLETILGAYAQVLEGGSGDVFSMDRFRKRSAELMLQFLAAGGPARLFGDDLLQNTSS